MCKILLTFYRRLFDSLKSQVQLYFFCLFGRFYLPLSNQIGSEYIRDTISFFVQMFSNVDIQKMFERGNPVEMKVLGTFLKLLTSVVEVWGG
jgi:hypothetical protein